MSVSPPKSGDTVTPASITSMYESVRALVNAQTEDTVTRGTFGPQHSPSLLLQAEFLESTTLETISGPFGWAFPGPGLPFDEADYTYWQDLASYKLDNAGAGYTLTPGYVLMFASIRWSAHSVIATSHPPVEQELWFNFYYVLNGTTHKLPINNRMLRNFQDRNDAVGPTPDMDWPQEAEETVTWWMLLDARSLGPTFSLKMGVLSINQRASGLDTQDCYLPNGLIGFVNLYGG